MAQPSEPRSPAFVVVVTGTGLQAGALALSVSAPIAVVTAHRDPDCVIVADADEDWVRAVRAAHPRALVLAVSPSASAAAVLAAGAAACVADADTRLVAAQLRALWRRFGARLAQPGQGAAAVRRAEPDLAARLADRTSHDRESQP
jgi:hypothetical protein